MKCIVNEAAFPENPNDVYLKKNVVKRGIASQPIAQIRAGSTQQTQVNKEASSMLSLRK